MKELIPIGYALTGNQFPCLDSIRRYLTLLFTN